MASDRPSRSGDSGRAPRGANRPARGRAKPKRARVPALFALVAVLVALVAGILIGYAAAGDPAPAGLVTQERTVPVVTVTVPEDPAR